DTYRHHAGERAVFRIEAARESDHRTAGTAAYRQRRIDAQALVGMRTVELEVIAIDRIDRRAGQRAGDADAVAVDDADVEIGGRWIQAFTQLILQVDLAIAVFPVVFETERQGVDLVDGTRELLGVGIGERCGHRNGIAFRFLV